MPLFQVDSESKNNGAIESESWFRAVPVDEFINRMIIRPLTALRSKAVQYGGLRLFEIDRTRDRFGGFLFLRCLGILGGLLRRHP